MHTDITLLLMDLLEQKKIYAFVGKVGMDRNSPDYYIEKNEKMRQKDSWKNARKKIILMLSL